MRRTALLILAFALLLAGCGPAGPTTTSPDEAAPSPTAEANGAEGSSTGEGGREAQFPNPIIVYERTGGLAGEMNKWTIHETGLIEDREGSRVELAAELVRPIFELVESEAFQQLEPSYGVESRCADCYTHTITVYGDDDPQQVIVVEGAVELPAALDDALAAINKVVTLQ